MALATTAPAQPSWRIRGARSPGAGLSISARPAPAILADHDEARRLLPSADHDGLADIVFERAARRRRSFASTLCRTGGRPLIAGYHQDGMRTVDLPLWNWRPRHRERAPARGIAPRHRHAPRVGLVQRGVLDLDALFTHRVGLDGLSAAFAWIGFRPDGFLKAVVTM